MAVAEHTRAQELKKIEDNLKNMVKSMFAEQNRKNDAAFVEVNQKQEHIASTQVLLREEIRKISLATASSSLRNGEVPQVTNHSFEIESDYQISDRITKIEFPKFDGKNVEGWIYHCERFFEVDRTLTMLKLGLFPCI